MRVDEKAKCADVDCTFLSPFVWHRIICGLSLSDRNLLEKYFSLDDGDGAWRIPVEVIFWKSNIYINTSARLAATVIHDAVDCKLRARDFQMSGFRVASCPVGVL